VKLWPGLLGGDPLGEPFTVVGSDHLAVNIWWERAQQIPLARMSLTYFDADGEWLLKLQGNDFNPNYYDGSGEYTITFDEYSLTRLGDAIGPYQPLDPAQQVTLAFSKNK
jgi:hypothetical protein